MGCAMRAWLLCVKHGCGCTVWALLAAPWLGAMRGHGLTDIPHREDGKLARLGIDAEFPSSSQVHGFTEEEE